MSLEIWTADAIILGAVGFMIVSWVFEAPTRRAPVQAAAKPSRKPR
ncbi:MAG TPA: hypothetical protein VN806_01595 [Caulobacteraceae bacterium]|jgi:hypothetical protein|nr:hypothetical protein [Caulobacteraceae bacterium]